MQAAKIKRGATFKATITFDADEWAAIYPWTSIEAEVGQGSRRYPLTVTINSSGVQSAPAGPASIAF